ncbi:MAG TPA: cupin domain-containing protein, partial [Planctomycetota bacterium]|nr:cupin domain-containing protein [Planctomycetota bacterium]
MAKGYCPFHSHSDLEIVYHVRGTGHTDLPDGRQFPFTHRSVIVYGPNVPHDQTILTRGEDACIHIRLPAQTKLPDDCLSVPPLSDPYLLNELMLLSNIRSWKDPADEACLNHRATALLLRL